MKMNSPEKHHAAEWMRCIISAGGDENVAQQAIALAALNGLFDHFRKTEANRWPPGDDPRQECE